MTRSPRFDAVLFDFGNTLFSTASGVASCVEHARAQGISVDPEAVRSRIAHAWARARTPEEIATGRDLDPVRHRQGWLDLYAPLDELAPGLAEHLYECETTEAGWQPFTDTEPVLRALHERGVPIAIVSDVAFDLRSIVAAYGLDRYVSAYALSGEVGVTKPHPAMFERACDGLGIAPRQGLMVGDSPAADGGAATLGMAVVLFPPPSGGGARGLDLVLRAVFSARRHAT